MNKEQIKLLEERREKIKEERTIHIFIILPITVVVMFILSYFIGLLFSFILVFIAIVLLFPSYKTTEKELRDIEFKLAGEKKR